MPIDSLNTEQIYKNQIPKFKIDTHQINKLIDSEAILQVYYDLFVKYLQTIVNEPSPSKKRYYGHYLEGIIDKIQKDKLIQNSQTSKAKLIQKISFFVEVLADPQNISLISNKAHTILDAGQTYGFHESITHEINQQVSEYIKKNLISWAENEKIPELTSQLKEQTTKLVIILESNDMTNNYIEKGQKFWENCLNLTEKFFLPKALEFDINQEYKNHLVQFKKVKNPLITGVLNSIKAGLNDNLAGKILSDQIQSNICNFDPNARIAQVLQIITKLIKRLFIYLQSKIDI